MQNFRLDEPVYVGTRRIYRWGERKGTSGAYLTFPKLTLPEAATGKLLKVIIVSEHLATPVVVYRRVRRAAGLTIVTLPKAIIPYDSALIGATVRTYAFPTEEWSSSPSPPEVAWVDSRQSVVAVPK